MSRYDFAAPRLYVNPPLARAAQIVLDQTQANYVRNVLRLSVGGKILVFNGCDGEWETHVAMSNRKCVTLVADKLTRPQELASRSALFVRAAETGKTGLHG